MNYRLYDGFNIVEEGEKEMVYIRKRGKALAEETGRNIRCELYNDYLNKWQYVGLTQPDGISFDAFGCRCKLDEDGRNYWIVKD